MNKKTNPADAAKAARLAAALRENLKRRKAQARAQARALVEKPQTAPDGPAAPEPRSGQD